MIIRACVSLYSYLCLCVYDRQDEGNIIQCSCASLMRHTNNWTTCLGRPVCDRSLSTRVPIGSCYNNHKVCVYVFHVCLCVCIVQTDEAGIWCLDYRDVLMRNKNALVKAHESVTLRSERVKQRGSDDEHVLECLHVCTFSG